MLQVTKPPTIRILLLQTTFRFLRRTEMWACRKSVPVSYTHLMSNSSEKKKRYNIPLWCKPNLSIEEAAAYSGIGMGKLDEMTESQECPFVLWSGSRRMIKRKVFDEFIERQYAI